MAVEYRKSSLTSLFEQLPTLILGYMAQQRKLEHDEYKFERRFEQERDLLNIRLESNETAADTQYLIGKRDTLSEGVVDSLHELSLKYPSLKPQDYTQGSDKIISDALLISDNKQKSLTEEIKGLGLKQKALRSLEGNLVSEISDFRTGYGPYAGESGVLNPNEFLRYRESLGELGETTQFAGLFPHTTVPSYQDSLAVINKNPGNIKFANQPGAQLGPTGFAQFSTEQQGWQALYNQVGLDQGRGDTVEQLIKGGNLNAITATRPVDSGWSADSPAIQDEYVRFISDQLGVDKDTPISNVDTQQLVQAISMFEGYLEKGQVAPGEIDLTQTYGLDDSELKLRQLAFDVGYQMMGDPAQLWALERETINALKTPLETASTRAYATIQGLFAFNEDKGIKDMEDLAESLTYPDPVTGEEKIPSIQAMNTVGNMLGQPDYDKFLNNMYLYENLPGATQGQIDAAVEVRELLENAPGLNYNFRNMETDYSDELILEAEKAGHPSVETPEQTMDLFKTKLNELDTTNIKSVLDEYMRTVSGVTPDLHEAHWNILEELYKDTNVDIHSEFTDYMKGIAGSGNLGAPVSTKITEKFVSGNTDPVFSDEDRLKALENFNKEVDEYNSIQSDYIMWDLGTGKAAVKHLDEYAASYDSPSKRTKRIDERNVRVGEYHSYVKKFHDLVKIEVATSQYSKDLGYGDYDYSDPQAWYQLGAARRESKGKRGAQLEHARKVVQEAHPELWAQIQSLSVDPVTEEVDLFDLFELSEDSQGVTVGKTVGEGINVASDRSYFAPGHGGKDYMGDYNYGLDFLYDTPAEGVSNVLVDLSKPGMKQKYSYANMTRPKYDAAQDVDAALHALNLLEDPASQTQILGSSGTATHPLNYIPKSMYDVHGEDIIGHQEPRLGAGRTYADAQWEIARGDEFQYVGPDDVFTKTGQTVPIEEVINYTMGKHAGGDRIGYYTLPLIPHGEKFKEITADWDDEKKQAYVDMLEDWLARNRKGMHTKEKVEIDILDIFDK